MGLSLSNTSTFLKAGKPLLALRATSREARHNLLKFLPMQKELAISIPISKNRVLAALPKAELDRLTPHFSIVTLWRGTILVEAGEKARHAYFLETGLASIATRMKGGRSVEVRIVGTEDIIG